MEWDPSVIWAGITTFTFVLGIWGFKLQRAKTIAETEKHRAEQRLFEKKAEVEELQKGMFQEVDEADSISNEKKCLLFLAYPDGGYLFGRSRDGAFLSRNLNLPSKEGRLHLSFERGEKKTVSLGNEVCETELVDDFINAFREMEYGYFEPRGMSGESYEISPSGYNLVKARQMEFRQTCVDYFRQHFGFDLSSLSQ